MQSVETCGQRYRKKKTQTDRRYPNNPVTVINGFQISIASGVII